MPKVKPGWKCNHFLESFWCPKTRLDLIPCLFGTALSGKASCSLQSTTESSLTDTITLFFYPLTTDKWPTYCAYKSLIFLLPLLLLRLLILPLQALCFLKSSQVSKVGKRERVVSLFIKVAKLVYSIQSNSICVPSPHTAVQRFSRKLFFFLFLSSTPSTVLKNIKEGCTKAIILYLLLLWIQNIKWCTPVLIWFP